MNSWTGSTQTAIMVADQIEKRWGREESIKYQPGINCLTFWGWKNKGYKIKEGEKGLRTYKYEKQGRKLVKTYMMVYYHLQVYKSELA